jgi:hypothetical protein
MLARFFYHSKTLDLLHQRTRARYEGGRDLLTAFCPSASGKGAADLTPIHRIGMECQDIRLYSRHPNSSWSKCISPGDGECLRLRHDGHEKEQLEKRAATVGGRLGKTGLEAMVSGPGPGSVEG